MHTLLNIYAELAKLAGELGIGITLSVYPEPEEENMEGKPEKHPPARRGATD